MHERELDQINLAKAIFAGAIPDKDDYCGCPRCGHRELLHDGSSLDNGYISCLKCYFSINGNNPYEMVSRWNSIDRGSFQLKIIFEDYFI